MEERKRYNYQVGVASIGKFTKPAIEFAANNKIPLLSLSWFLNSAIEDRFQSIDNNYLSRAGIQYINLVYKYLKDKKYDSEFSSRNQNAKDWLEVDDVIGSIIQSFDEVLDYSYVGIIETGDLVFLFPNGENSGVEILRDLQSEIPLKAQIHYFNNMPNHWTLDIFDEYDRFIGEIAKFKFFLPERIMNYWKKHSFSRHQAISIKQDFFSRIFIFKKGTNSNFPFFLVNLDKEWLNNVKADA